MSQQHQTLFVLMIRSSVGISLAQIPGTHEALVVMLEAKIRRCSSASSKILMVFGCTGTLLRNCFGRRGAFPLRNGHPQHLQCMFGKKAV